MAVRRVCPMPMAWERTRASLERARAQRAPQAPKVPVPLILAGWNYSTDDDKRRRWDETLAWAAEHGLSDSIPSIADDEWHCAD
jgi:hypothetical protein